MSEKKRNAHNHWPHTMKLRELFLLYWCVGGSLMASAFSQSATAAEPITLQYNERPPYMRTYSNNVVAGLSATPAAQAFEKAGIPFVWSKVPATRQLSALKNNQVKVCSVGLYKTAEREAFGKFTSSISQDSPMVALALASFKPPKSLTLDELFSDASLNILLKQSFLYGPPLDDKLASGQARKQYTINELDGIVKMIELGRAHITFMPREEADYYFSAGLFDFSKFNVITFPEIPRGPRRYILCSKLVEDEVIEKLNTALSTIVK